MPLNSAGQKHVEIALNIVAGTITKAEEIDDNERYFLRNNGDIEKDLKGCAIRYLARTIAASTPDGFSASTRPGGSS